MTGVSEVFFFVLVGFFPGFFCLIQIYVLSTLKGHTNDKNYDSMKTARKKAA